MVGLIELAFNRFSTSNHLSSAFDVITSEMKLKVRKRKLGLHSVLDENYSDMNKALKIGFCSNVHILDTRICTNIDTKLLRGGSRKIIENGYLMINYNFPSKRI